MEPDTSASPYAPPQAVVADIDLPAAEAGRAPSALRRAIIVLWASWGINFAWVTFRVLQASARGAFPAAQFIGFIIGALIAAGIYFMLGQNRNWARVLLIIVGAFTLAAFFIGIARQGGRYFSIHDLPLHLVDLMHFYAYGLLLTRPVNAWFRAAKERR